MMPTSFALRDELAALLLEAGAAPDLEAARARLDAALSALPEAVPAALDATRRRTASGAACEPSTFVHSGAKLPWQ